MAFQPHPIIGYGLSQQLPSIFPSPIIAKRSPTVNDTGYQIGQLWIEPANTSNVAVNAAWVLTSVISNSANWLSLVGSGGAGVFSSLTVTPGPISLTGTTTINTSGAAATSIGTGGTGVVNIGNTTGGTAVTGPLGVTGLSTLAATTIVGTTNINASGAAVTTIGTGGTGAVDIGNATGNTAVTGSLTASGAITGATLYASGDLGGVALQNALSNVSVPVAGGSGAFTITSATGAGTATNAGFIKMYVGATAVFIPYYTVTA